MWELIGSVLKRIFVAPWFVAFATFSTALCWLFVPGDGGPLHVVVASGQANWFDAGPMVILQAILTIAVCRRVRFRNAMIVATVSYVIAMVPLVSGGFIGLNDEKSIVFALCLGAAVLLSMACVSITSPTSAPAAPAPRA